MYVLYKALFSKKYNVLSQYKDILLKFKSHSLFLRYLLFNQLYLTVQ